MVASPSRSASVSGIYMDPVDDAIVDVEEAEADCDDIVSGGSTKQCPSAHPLRTIRSSFRLRGDKLNLQIELVLVARRRWWFDDDKSLRGRTTISGWDTQSNARLDLPPNADDARDLRHSCDLRHHPALPEEASFLT